jgi:hypothetical protein
VPIPLVVRDVRREDLVQRREGLRREGLRREQLSEYI